MPANPSDVDRVYVSSRGVTSAWLNGVGSRLLNDARTDWRKWTDADLDPAAGQLLSRFNKLAGQLNVTHAATLTIEIAPGHVRYGDGAIVEIGNIAANTGFLLAVPNNATTTIFIDEAGAPRASNTVPTGAIVLAEVMTSGGTVVNIEDKRAWFTSGSNETLEALIATKQTAEQVQAAIDLALDPIEEAIATKQTAEQVQAAIDLALDPVATRLASIEAETETLNEAIEGLQGRVDGLQSSSQYQIITDAIFTVTPTSSVAYDGAQDAVATISPGGEAGQWIELRNISDFGVTIVATGLDIDGATLLAGEGIKYIWDGTTFQVVAISGGSIPAGGGGGTQLTTTTSLAQVAANPTQWVVPYSSVTQTGGFNVLDAAGQQVGYQGELVELAAGTVISANTSWGSNNADRSFVVAHCAGDLTINAGVTVTTTTRKLGLILYVDGNLVVNGTLSMTARGANHGTSGSNIPARGLLVASSAFGSNQIVEAVGGLGVSSSYVIAITNSQYVAKTGGSGIGGACGGGGCAQSSDFNGITSGGWGPDFVSSSTSTAGTCFTGGVGGGQDRFKAAEPNGGAGGAYYQSTGGGAGSPPGGSATAGQGGMLYVFVKGNLTISSQGSVRSLGSSGFNAGGPGGVTGTGYAYTVPRYGGGSGGGAVYIGHVGTFSNAGSIQVTGGAGSGAGGLGSTRVVNLPSIA